MLLQINAHRGLKMRYKELEKTRRLVEVEYTERIKERKKQKAKAERLVEI